MLLSQTSADPDTAGLDIPGLDIADLDTDTLETADRILLTWTLLALLFLWLLLSFSKS